MTYPTTKEERLEQLEIAKKNLALLNAVPIHDRVVFLKDIPPSVLGEFEKAMFGQAMPAVDQAFAWDFERFVSKYHKKVQALSAPTLSEEPIVIVDNWNVVKLLGKLLLTCRVIHSNTARSTSEIATFDLQNMTVITKSGRVYHLAGRPKRNDLFESQWGLLREKELFSSWV